MKPICVFILFCISLPLFAERPIPQLERRVTDEAGILSSSSVAKIEGQLEQLEKSTGAQVAVLIIESLEGQPLEDYSMSVVESWKLGRKGIDDGLLILVAVNDRKVRLEVGYGLEGILPDAACKRILDETILPEFKSGDYEAGIENGVYRISKIIETGEVLEPATPLQSLVQYRGLPGVEKFIFGGFSIFVIGIFTLILVLNKESPFWFLYIFLFIFWTVFPLVAFGFAVWKYIILSYIIGVPILRFFGSKIPIFGSIQSKVTANSIAVQSSGGWSSGGTSSGGFSGRGGSFGGGGASGSW